MPPAVYVQQLLTTGLFKHACLFIFAFQNQSNPFGHIRHCSSTLRCHAGFEGFCGLPQELLKSHTRLLCYNEWVTFTIHFDWCMKVSHLISLFKWLILAQWTLSALIWAMTKVHVAWNELWDLTVDRYCYKD